MSKTLYFDCAWGVTEDMLLGALIDISDLEEYLVRELKKIFPDGLKINFSKKQNNRVFATTVTVNPDCAFSLYKDAIDMIRNAALKDGAKKLSERILINIMEAERKIYARSSDDLTFGGSLPSKTLIVIVSTAILIDRIHPDRILAGTVSDGCGFVISDRGIISVPDPVTGQIIAAAKMRLQQLDVNAELITPAGAAILAELVQEYKPLPAMTVEKTGWGAALEDKPVPGLLRVYFGRTDEPSKDINSEEDFIVMETNIDDCSGEILGYTMDLLMDEGALDVFYTPVYMKKNRPAYLLTVTCRREDMEKLQNLVFRETTSIGIRFRSEQRQKLERESIYVDTPCGPVKAKRVRLGDDYYVYPEYESLKELSACTGIPLKELYRLKLD